MKLIEVIYSSVGVFSIALVIIFILSFFAFKMKKKLGKNEKSNEIKLELKPNLKTRNGKSVPQKVKENSRKKVTKSKKEKKSIAKPKANVFTKKPPPRIQVLNKKKVEKEKPLEKAQKKEKNLDSDVFNHYCDSSESDDFKSITDQE